MTKILIAVSALTFSFASFVFAAEGAIPKNRPCKNIRAACEAAGFVQGGHKKNQPKGLWKDCYQPILAGQAVAGVNVISTDIEACKAAAQRRKASKAQ